ncbi:MAG: hypothetical protein WC428_00195 [Candidatus Paceibacterota bacterium]|jgi:hypothetical protein
MSNSSQKFLIIKDRVEIYRDFALNLLYYIHYYYLDKESLSKDEDIYNHYSWCFKKVCDEFLLEKIDFTKNSELKDYYYDYYYHQFYKIDKNNINQNTSLEYYERFWKGIFEINTQKNKNILNILVEIYNIYDKSINLEKNILEIV